MKKIKNTFLLLLIGKTRACHERMKCVETFLPFLFMSGLLKRVGNLHLLLLLIKDYIYFFNSQILEAILVGFEYQQHRGLGQYF